MKGINMLLLKSKIITIYFIILVFVKKYGLNLTV